MSIFTYTVMPVTTDYYHLQFRETNDSKRTHTRGSRKDLSFQGLENTCRKRNDYCFSGVGDCKVYLFSKLLLEKSQPELQHQTRENLPKDVCSCLFK